MSVCVHVFVCMRERKRDFPSHLHRILLRVSTTTIELVRPHDDHLAHPGSDPAGTPCRTWGCRGPWALSASEGAASPRSSAGNSRPCHLSDDDPRSWEQRQKLERAQEERKYKHGRQIHQPTQVIQPQNTIFNFNLVLTAIEVGH